MARTLKSKKVIKDSTKGESPGMKAAVFGKLGSTLAELKRTMCRAMVICLLILLMMVSK